MMHLISNAKLEEKVVKVKRKKEKKKEKTKKKVQHCNTVCRFRKNFGWEVAVYSNVSFYVNEGYLLGGVFTDAADCVGGCSWSPLVSWLVVPKIISKFFIFLVLALWCGVYHNPPIFFKKD